MGSFNGDGRAIFMVFIGAIITITLMIVIGNAIVPQTTIITKTNVTVTGANVNATLDLTGRQIVTTVAIVNATNGTKTLVGLGGSLQTGIGSNGLLSVQLLLNDTASAYAGQSINVSYTANPDGYISDSGGRAIARLILIFGALAIMVFVFVVFMKEGTLGKMMGRKN